MLRLARLALQFRRIVGGALPMVLLALVAVLMLIFPIGWGDVFGIFTDRSSVIKRVGDYILPAPR